MALKKFTFIKCSGQTRYSHSEVFRKIVVKAPLSSLLEKAPLQNQFLQGFSADFLLIQ